ncbi:MAG: hypothetical protein Q9O62_03245 [Ardenticatenia bacterium]|nr:hypothetical protein [Ardenticatenia bacterium]
MEGGVADGTARVRLTEQDVLALKAGLEVLEGECRRGDISAPGAAAYHVEVLLGRLRPLVEAERATTVTLTRSEAAVLAYYVERAMRLRGYVVGRPQANEWFVGLYRKLRAVAQGRATDIVPRWRRWVKRWLRGWVSGR